MTTATIQPRALAPEGPAPALPLPAPVLPDETTLARHLAELEEVGFTVIRGFLDRPTCARLRAHTDRILGPIQPEQGWKDCRHPMPCDGTGEVLAEMVTETHLELARRQLHAQGLPADRLRLTEQVLIRTGRTTGPGDGRCWHIDGVFYPRHRATAPRLTYVQNVHALSDIEAGGGATMVVPGSHRRHYAASEELAKGGERFPMLDQKGFRAEVTRLAGVDPAQGVEILAKEGDLVLFDPMCLHTGTANRRERPRYVFFQSFYTTMASDFHAILEDTSYRSHFPEALRLGLPERLRPLVSRSLD
jgi:ectoine hydroxylase-related dioxygenase (phytanoyl-CoA dioxygenase family)